jgi:hypothetical protein
LVSPISSLAPFYGDLSDVCLIEVNPRQRLLSNLFEGASKSGKAQGPKSGKAELLHEECFSPAGEYRTCFHRATTLETCDTISSGKPFVANDEVLVAGIMHLTLLQDGTPVTCQKKIQLEKAILTYLADNVGSDSTFEPVCAYAGKNAVSKQLVPDGDGQYVESTAIEIEMQYIYKNGSRKLFTEYNDQYARRLQTDRCTTTNRALCCSQHAINSYIGEYCASLGCSSSSNRCGSGRRRRHSNRELSQEVEIYLVERRIGKAGKGSKAQTLFYGKSAKASGKSNKSSKADHHVMLNACPWYGMLYGDDFNEVVKKYSLFNPKETRSLLGIKDTTSCAKCSANRYSIDEFDTPSLPCVDFISENCPENEDLPSIITQPPVDPPPVPPPPTPFLTEIPTDQPIEAQISDIPTLPLAPSEPTNTGSSPPQENVIPTMLPVPIPTPTLPPMSLSIPTLPPIVGGLPTMPPVNASSPPVSLVFTPAPSTSTISQSPWDFESGIFPEIPWKTGGSGIWKIDTEKVDGGSYSIKSPDLENRGISGPQVSNATLTLDSDFAGGLIKVRVIAR